MESVHVSDQRVGQFCLDSSFCTLLSALAERSLDKGSYTTDCSRVSTNTGVCLPQEA
jgi:hypothetical protein